MASDACLSVRDDDLISSGNDLGPNSELDHGPSAVLYRRHLKTVVTNRSTGYVGVYFQSIWWGPLGDRHL
jgi:hypothetical protein